MNRLRVCDAAMLVLKETNNDAVMWGDSVLLHQIAEKAGMPHDSWKTEEKVLNALSRQPGNLVPGYTRLVQPERLVRVFRLPEK